MEIYQDYDWAKLYAEYKRGTSLLDLAFIYKMSVNTISRYFKKNGFIIRKPNGRKTYYE